MNPTPRFIKNLVIIHVAATWFMVGLIWTIHTLHYPSFPDVGEATYVVFQANHVQRIGRLLVVPWLTEGITLVGVMWLAFLGPRRDLRLPVAIGAIAMGVVLIVSGFWSAPAHGELAKGFDAAVHHRLMTSNVIRTLAWTVCGITAAWILNLVWKDSSPQTETLATS